MKTSRFSIVPTFVLLLSLVTAGCVDSDGEPDTDNDGVADRVDECPDTAQYKPVDPNWNFAVVVDEERLSSTPQAYPVDSSGCEFDNDGDGVVNSQDYCPDDSSEAISAGVAANGCPKHSDADGTPDYRDKCPDTPAGSPADADGCPV